jgi:riboflavin synthase alpha subunit
MSLHECYRKWVEIGKELGLADNALTEFVKAHVDQEREIRKVEREAKKIELEMQAQQQQEIRAAE